MSVPRTIWAASPTEECFFTARDWQSNDDDDLYHHDDVVRELRRAVLMAAYHDGRDGEVAVDAFDAALAKIAQEGQR